MLVALALFWGVAFYRQGPELGLFIVAAVTAYPALLMACNSTWLSVKPDLLRTHPGPIPIAGGRRSLNPADIEAIFTTVQRGMAGRGGRSERYALVADTGNGRKPVTILDPFESEKDAVAAARMLIHHLNKLRPPGAAPVAFRRT